MVLEHKTVLLNETIDSLKLDRFVESSCEESSSIIVVDCTCGYGGHLQYLLEKYNSILEKIKVIAIDQDSQAIDFLTHKFESYIQAGTVRLVQDKFSNLDYILDDLNIKKVHAIYADLGVSTHQILSRERGFSFLNDGPLDMRMGPSPISAYDIVNSSSKEELVKILKEFGQEPKANFIADAIIKERQTAPINSTCQLARIVQNAVFYKKPSKIHPATRTFMAIRIAVNNELEEVKSLIQTGFSRLEKEGILSIITFHSLEDAIVKNGFIDLTGKRKYDSIPRDVVLEKSQLDKMVNAQAIIIKPFPVLPSKEELSFNPRSRSAKLRVIQKIK